MQEQDLAVEWILETHVHADHLTAAPYLKERLGGRIGIGARIDRVQGVFKKVFNAEAEFATDGRQFDHLFEDGEAFRIGALDAEVIHTPGHTPACVTYVVGDAAFVGDTLFMPDGGTARCGLPRRRCAAAAVPLHPASILSLPRETCGCSSATTTLPERPRKLEFETTVAAQRESQHPCPQRHGQRGRPSCEMRERPRQTPWACPR